MESSNWLGNNYLNFSISDIILRLKQKKTLAWNISYYFIASVIGALIQLIINPFLALKMEYYDYAIVGYYASFNALLSPLILFSLSSYYARTYFLISENNRESLRNTVTVMSLSFSFFLALISFLALVVYFKISNVNFPLFPYAIITISGIFFNSVYTLLIVDLRMSRKAKKYMYVSVLYGLISALSAILLVVVFGLGGLGRMLATMFATLIFFIYAITQLLSRWELDWGQFKSAIKFCWPLAAAAMLGYFSSGVDRTMLEKLHNMKSLGLYNIGSQVAGYLSMFTLALSQTFQPDIYKSIAERNVSKTALIILMITGLSLLPIGMFMIFATPLLSILTFGRFTSAAGFARILALKNLTQGLYHSLSGVLEGYGLTKTVLVTRLIGSVALVGMFSYIIGNYGFNGAAWGQVLSFVFMIIITILYLLITNYSSIKRNLKKVVFRANN